MIYVHLIDVDDATIVVRCADEAAAERLAASATMSDGEVSAYIVPTEAISDSGALRAYLRAGGDVKGLNDAEFSRGDVPYPPDLTFTPIDLQA